MNVQFPKILRPFMGKLTWRKNPLEKVIYLTFDDGPVPEITPLVLEILEKYQLKATFFCVGENVQKYPKVYANVLDCGHKTGNHTFNHLKGFSTNVQAYVENVEKASKLIESSLFRPPHGQITYKQLQALKSDFEIVMWDLITHDYNADLSAEIVFQNVKKYARNGSIIVFHDSIKAKENVLKALPLTIEYLKSEGFSFGVL